MFVVMGMLAVLLAVLVVQVQFAYRRRKLCAQSWDSILTRIEKVDFRGLREIADWYREPHQDWQGIDPLDMWTRLGGLTGLQKMRQNSRTMLQLAMYAERWNTENGRMVSELIRRDAMRLKKATMKIELAMLNPYGMVQAASSLQEAISSYCLMRERLVGLYQIAQAGLTPQLEAVV